MIVEIRDWCQNVGEYNTYNFCIWRFGLCVIVSKIERCRSSDPPYEIAINPWWRGGRGLPSLIALLYWYHCFIFNVINSAMDDLYLISYTLRSKGAKWHLLGFFGLSLYWHPQMVLQRTLISKSVGATLKPGQWNAIHVK